MAGLHVDRESWHSRRTPLSVVIPTHDDASHLPIVLDSLGRAASRPLDVIVVDAGSQDATADIVQDFGRTAAPHLAVRLLSSAVHNASAQRNLGALAARHATILFLDADTVLEATEDLDALVDRFLGHRLAAASCRFRPVERDIRAEICCAALYGFQRLVEHWGPAATGACIITHRDVFRSCGGFDPRLHVGGEANFCRKAACLGRFRTLPVCLHIPAHRFARHGYVRTVWRELRLYLRRMLWGEVYGTAAPEERVEVGWPGDWRR